MLQPKEEKMHDENRKNKSYKENQPNKEPS